MTRTILGASFIFLGGCAGDTPECYIEATNAVAASALVQSATHAGNGFLIDREERLLLTTLSGIDGKEELTVVFPVINNGKALIHKTKWEAKAKQCWRTTQGRILCADPFRNVAVVRLKSVPEDVPELTLAEQSSEKGASVQFLGNAAEGDLAWAPMASTVLEVGSRQVTAAGDKPVINRMLELAAAGQLGQGVAGGAVLNGHNQVVGIIAGGPADSRYVICTDVSEIRPSVAAAYRTRSVETAEQGKYSLALSYSNRALAVWSEDPLGLHDRGTVYAQKNEFAKAVVDYTAALKLEPRLAMAHRNRAAAYLQLGKHAEAVADYTRALELEPDLPMAYRNRGHAYLQQGKYEEAVADCTKAISLAPGYQKAYQTRSQAYTKLNRTQEAEADSRKVAALNKSDSNSKWKTVKVTGDASASTSGKNPFSADQPTRVDYYGDSMSRYTGGYYGGGPGNVGVYYRP
jgi:tetratricopeptide (TPR) repeat protein